MATVRFLIRRWPLKKVLRSLAARYGPPRALPARGAFELILWENVAYLADDDRRARAFRELQARVGTKPEAILRAPEEVLREVAGAGIMAHQQVGKLRLSAEIALQKFGGDLGPALADLRQARKALSRFPAIGEPGAEKILLLTRSHPILALDSNGLRVLLRLGFGQEAKGYSASYGSEGGDGGGRQGLRRAYPCTRSAAAPRPGDVQAIAPALRGVPPYGRLPVLPARAPLATAPRAAGSRS